MSKPIKRTVRVSEEAYSEIKRRAAANPDKFRSRGAVGVIDWLLFKKFTNRGRGESVSKTKKKQKPLDKR